MTKPDIARMLGVSQAHEVPVVGVTDLTAAGWFAALSDARLAAKVAKNDWLVQKLAEIHVTLASINGQREAAPALELELAPIPRTDPDPLPPGERVMRAKPFDLMHEIRVRVSRLYDEYCSIMRSEFDFPGSPWTPERDNDTAAMDVAELLVMLADPQLEQPALNRDATVAVSPTYTYNEDMSQAPRGVKLILLGQGGVAQLSEYNGDPFWIGWAALPRRAQG